MEFEEEMIWPQFAKFSHSWLCSQDAIHLSFETLRMVPQHSYPESEEQEDLKSYWSISSTYATVITT